MKKTIMYLGKYFCLMLGIFLFTSSVGVYGQVTAEDALMKEMSSLYRLNYYQDLRYLGLDLEEMEALLKNPNEVLDTWLMSWYKGDGVINFNKSYLGKREKWYVLKSKAEHILNGGSVEELSSMYTDHLTYSLSDLEKAEISRFDPSQFVHKGLFWLEKDRESYDRVLQQKYHAVKKYQSGNIAYWIYDEDFKKLKASVRYFRGKYDEMKESYFLAQKAKAELLRHKYTPVDVMKYAYKNGMLPKEKAGVKLTLKAMDNDVSMNALVRSIRAYLTEFGSSIKDVNIIKSGLTKELKGMSVAERTKYVDGITELTPGSKNFIKDFEILEESGKKYVGRNITKGFWVLAGLGAVATAAYITDVAAYNHFNSGYTMSNRDLAIVGKKIEDGTATIKEKVAFFTNPNSQRFVETDPVYTLSFVQLASDIYAADEFLKETQKAQEQQIQNNVEQNVLKNLNKQMSTTDFGVGSL